MADIEDEDTITMMDVIERENKLEEEASAVLGNSDEKNCTYPRGYIARQALYSCATCFSDSGQEAAICLACSLECHDNHEVYELYTKRNYRCDCGNERFKKDFECKFADKVSEKKTSLNENNVYNHNFSGRYCSCDHRYPPDENDESPESDDEMWQCIVCEDWYHTKHLGATDLPTKFEEMACDRCVDRLDFLKFYKLIEHIDESKRRTFKNDDDDDDDESASKTGDNTEIVGPFSMLHSRPTSCVAEKVEKVKEEEKVSKSTVDAPESDTNDSQAENKDPVDTILDKQKQQEVPEQVEQNQEQQQARPDKKVDETTSLSSYCILLLLKDVANEKKNDETKLDGPIFWSDCEWRRELCRCQQCMAMYDSKKCLFLIDEKDTVQYYEAQGKALAKNCPTPLERGMTALNRMNRAAVAEAMNGYQELKADLSVYLRKFADNNKVVREEDIHEFFEQLKSKKRFKLDDI